MINLKKMHASVSKNSLICLFSNLKKWLSSLEFQFRFGFFRLIQNCQDYPNNCCCQEVFFAGSRKEGKDREAPYNSTPSCCSFGWLYTMGPNYLSQSITCNRGDTIERRLTMAHYCTHLCYPRTILHIIQSRELGQASLSLSTPPGFQNLTMTLLNSIRCCLKLAINRDN